MQPGALWACGPSRGWESLRWEQAEARDLCASHGSTPARVRDLSTVHGAVRGPRGVCAHSRAGAGGHVRASCGSPKACCAQRKPALGLEKPRNRRRTWPSRSRLRRTADVSCAFSPANDRRMRDFDYVL